MFLFSSSAVLRHSCDMSVLLNFMTSWSGLKFPKIARAELATRKKSLITTISTKMGFTIYGKKNRILLSKTP